MKVEKNLQQESPGPRSRIEKLKSNQNLGKIRKLRENRLFQPMQPASGGESGELSRSGGLARFRSAPATWLEALLESDEESSDVVLELPKPPSDAATDLELLESAGSGGLSNFLRQNSSPAEFLSLLNNTDGYFSSLGIPASYGYHSSTSAKRARQGDTLDKPSPKLSSSSLMPVKEENGEQGEFMSLEAEMDNLFEDSIMCRVRAKRGCATHPRSIAERMRRTRISDRIRKLQELVPDMDKQTNTADMLEEAVAYVKFLQNQIQELTDNQKNCKCSSKD